MARPDLDSTSNRFTGTPEIGGVGLCANNGVFRMKSNDSPPRRSGRQNDGWPTAPLLLARLCRGIVRRAECVRRISSKSLREWRDAIRADAAASGQVLGLEAPSRLCPVRDPCQGLVRAVEAMRAAYPRTEITAVAGNHEFYGRTFGEELQAGRERARELGVHLLENGTLVFGRLCIIGATLWTDYSLFGESLRLPAMRVASEAMRDHRRTKWERDPWKRVRPQDAHMLPLRSRAYSEMELAKPHDRPTVVLTHHASGVEALQPQLRGRMIAAAYASDLGSTIDRYQPDYWISGHTHFPIDLRRHRTPPIS